MSQNNNVSSGVQNRRIKPTLDTKFHIDYTWWDNQAMELRAYILSFVSEDRRAQLQDLPNESKMDWIDPETAEVKQVDAFEQALSELIDDTNYAQMPLVDAIFKIFLMNGNQALSPNELEPKIERPAKTILRTIAGTHVYRGIRPAAEDEA